MNKRTLLNLALAALVAGIGLFLYFRPGEDAAKTYPLSDQTAAAVRAIEIDKADQAPIHLEKTPTGWMLTAPFKARANAFKVQEILDILDARSTLNLPNSRPAEYQLDKPLATLVLNGQSFHFGMMSPIQQMQYVGSEGRVYLLPPRYFSRLLGAPADFASKSLLAAGETPIGFDFPGVHLLQSEGTWSVTPPDPAFTPDRLNQLADDWQQASSLITQPYNGKPPLERFAVRLADGRRIPMAVLETAPEFVLLREDENLEYHFPQGAADTLLAPRATKQSARSTPVPQD